MTLNVALRNQKASLAQMHMNSLHLYVQMLKIVDDIFRLKMMYLMIVFDKVIFICQSEVIMMFTCFLNFLIETLRKYFDVLHCVR